MAGVYEGCFGEESDDPALDFRKKGGYKSGYTLSVPCSHIANFEVLQKAGKDL